MKSFVFIYLALVTFWITGEACRKPGPPKAVITVVDTLSYPVSGAKVYINSNNSNPPGIISDIQYTNSEGKTYHTFKAEAILQVEVSKPIQSDTLKGMDILRLESDKTIEKTIVIR